VLGVQKGTGDPDRVIILSAHIDSRVTDPMNFTSDAPGANDDGSGVALVIEAARILSREPHRATIVFAILSGEEQGLYGGQLLARTAKARGWQVAAQLNNDIVGNSHGSGGDHVDNRVRVFSEGIRASETLDEARTRRAIGGEDDGPSRALAKFVDHIGTSGHGGLEVVAIRRPDRFGRGGDHLPALDLGFPAVRITEASENYDRQHQDVRVEGTRHYGDTIDGVDFPYLAKVTNLNVAVARALAQAPAAPAAATITGAVTADTTVNWAPVPGATGYRIHWRRADGTIWTNRRDVTSGPIVMKNVNIDDNFFGVSSLGADGAESLITFAGAAPRK
jgi:Zn-dependent M28 family amino/carboxypeptidase